MSLLHDFDMTADQYAHLSDGDVITPELDAESELEREDREQMMSEEDKAFLELDVPADAEKQNQQAETTPALSPPAQVSIGLMMLPFYMAARMKTLSEEKLMHWREQRAFASRQAVRRHTSELDRLLDAHQASQGQDKGHAATKDKIRQRIDLITRESQRATAYYGRLPGKAELLKQFKDEINETLTSRADILQGISHKGASMSEHLGKQLDLILERINAMLAALGLSATNRRASQVGGAAPSAA